MLDVLQFYSFITMIIHSFFPKVVYQMSAVLKTEMGNFLCSNFGQPSVSSFSMSSQFEGFLILAPLLKQEQGFLFGKTSQFFPVTTSKYQLVTENLSNVWPYIRKTCLSDYTEPKTLRVVTAYISDVTSTSDFLKTLHFYTIQLVVNLLSFCF